MKTVALVAALVLLVAFAAVPASAGGGHGKKALKHQDKENEEACAKGLSACDPHGKSGDDQDHVDPYRTAFRALAAFVEAARGTAEIYHDLSAPVKHLIHKIEEVAHATVSRLVHDHAHQKPTSAHAEDIIGHDLTSVKSSTVENYEALLEHLKDICPGVYMQAQKKGPWLRSDQVHAHSEESAHSKKGGHGLLAVPLSISLEGVLARACLTEKDQRKYLFGEYKFMRVKDSEDPHADLAMPLQIIPDDKVPLMSAVTRVGSIVFAEAKKHEEQRVEKQRKDEGLTPLSELSDNEQHLAAESIFKVAFEQMRRATVEQLKLNFPWAALYVQDQCTWVFNTAGMGYAHLCYLYGSVSENVVFWGSPIGNQGFSGSYDAKVWDHMLIGRMETFELRGEVTNFLMVPGQFHLLDRWGGNYYRIDRHAYMLDYVQGMVAQSIKFAVVNPTQYLTMDYRAAVTSICQYGTLVVNNFEDQAPSLVNEFITKAFAKIAGGEGTNLAELCKLHAGMDLSVTHNVEGKPIAEQSDEELDKYVANESIESVWMTYADRIIRDGGSNKDDVRLLLNLHLSEQWLRLETVKPPSALMYDEKLASLRKETGDARFVKRTGTRTRKAEEL